MTLHAENHTISETGVYRPFARFPVVPPEITLASYRQFIAARLEELPKLEDELEMLEFENTLGMMLSMMMSLPAASVFHHKTAGGLFYHSLDTAFLAAQHAINRGHSVEMILACLYGGLFHDLGKCVSMFRVQAYDNYEPWRGLMLERSAVWDPELGDLWSWCTDHEVKHLALQFKAGPVLGHQAHTARIWSNYVTEDMINKIAKDKQALHSLKTYLDKGFGGVGDIVKLADRESIERDANPAFRWEPKRSDLHLVRRFIEFASLSSWNQPISPFLMSRLWVVDKPTKTRLPLFRTNSHWIDEFRSYLFNEDRYGHSWSGDFATTCFQILETHGILQRRLPSMPHRYKASNELGINPGFQADILFIDDMPNEIYKEPVVYFPKAEGLVADNLPEVCLMAG